MQGAIFQYGLLAGLAIALLVAAFTDMRSRKIYNWLNGTIALGAPLFWIASGYALWPTIAIQIGLAVAVFAALALFFAMKWMLGGDIKLLTALALWLQPIHFLQLFIVMSLVGGVLTLIYGMWCIMRRQKDKIMIPYGIAISTAGLWVLGTKYLPAASAGAAGLG